MGTGNASHTFRKQAAGAFGPDLAKKLSQLVKMEKNVMRSMELVGRERMQVAVSYFFWDIGFLSSLTRPSGTTLEMGRGL